MSNLKLSHLGRRLPHGLWCEVTESNGQIIHAELTSLYKDSFQCGFAGLVESEKGFKSVKPILRPWSDFTKEIVQNGKTFIPMEELLLVAIEKKMEEENLKLVRHFVVAFANKSDLPNWIIEKALSWHFVIDEPYFLYIDVNTLPINPYAK